MSEKLVAGLGQFVPTTDIFDVQSLFEENINSDSWKLFLIRQREIMNRVILALNAKETALYNLAEFLPGQQWFPNPATLDSTTDPSSEQLYRQTFRTVVDFGALPDATTKSVAHNITDVSKAFSVTRIYGAATLPSATTADIRFIPLPYSSVTAVDDNIEIWADATNVNVKTASDYSAYTISYIILEVLKE